jgi:cysteine desulfuration protein SufE
MSRIEEIIETFQALDNDLRLELLMDYAEKLPQVPDEYRTKDQLEAHRVHECQTPVSIWIKLIDGKVHIYADVPQESPTVRGFISLLIKAFDGVSPNEVEKAPTDILNRSGLANTLGMMRMQGLSAIYRRIKDEMRLISSEENTSHVH